MNFILYDIVYGIVANKGAKIKVKSKNRNLLK